MFLLRDDISEITQILLDGGIICYPTDTVWAVGCDATQPEAVARVAALKRQPPGVGFVLLVSDIPMLKQYAHKIHPRLETLLAHHTRPLTVVYNHNTGLPDSVKASDGTAAIRIAQDEFCQTLIHALGKPLLSTAAHVLGQPFPPTFGAVSSEILTAVDYVVKYRQDDKEPQQPSPIARLDRHLELEFLRD
ncbi:MAG TPA: Sua5/YciO/YrdC/YwlC family protein [Saprospiraceae bacterium]|nr:Sua5/YciO/YrdC/YwlC family protein [Saprospiraceae bacterium]